MEWKDHLTLPERVACGMHDACETLEPAGIAMLAHPDNAELLERVRALLLTAIKEGSLLVIGAACDIGARQVIKAEPVVFSVITLSEWSGMSDLHKRCAQIVLQRMRQLATAGMSPVLQPAINERWPWQEDNGPDPKRVLASVCACDPQRLCPERVLMFDGTLSRRDIPREALRSFIATVPPPVRNRLFPQGSPLWLWLGQETGNSDAPALPAPSGRTRVVGIRKAVKAADAVLTARLHRVPEAREVFDYLAEHDETGTVVDHKTEPLMLIWEDSNGKLQEQSYKAMSNLLSDIRRVR